MSGRKTSPEPEESVKSENKTATDKNGELPAEEKNGHAQETDAGREKSENENEKIKARIEELQNSLLLQRADFENARKRIEKQKREELKYASLPFMRELLAVVDSLELALSYAGENDPLQKGVSMALDKIKKIFKDYNLEPIKAVGEEFDPSRHEAISVRHDDDTDDNVIVEEQRVGYMLLDRVVRASRVVINNRPKVKNAEEKE